MTKKEKGHIETEGVSDSQAFNWLKERLNQLSMNEEEDIAVLNLIGRIEKDFDKYKKDSVYWNNVKNNLTAKQTLKILENIDLK